MRGQTALDIPFTASQRDLNVRSSGTGSATSSTFSFLNFFFIPFVLLHLISFQGALNPRLTSQLVSFEYHSREFISFSIGTPDNLYRERNNPPVLLPEVQFSPRSKLSVGYAGIPTLIATSTAPSSVTSSSRAISLSNLSCLDITSK